MEMATLDCDPLPPLAGHSFAPDLHAFVSVCQVLSGAASARERSLGEIAQSLSAALPQWHSGADFLLLRSILVEFATRAIEAADGCAFPALLPLLRLKPDGQTLGDVLVQCLSGPRTGDGRRATSMHALRAARAVSVIRARCTEPNLDAARVALEINVSERALGKLLHAHAGAGFRRILRQTRVAAAQELLETSLFSVKEIAGQAGYTWTSQMDRDFGRECGITPGEYRLRHADAASRTGTASHSAAG